MGGGGSAGSLSYSIQTKRANLPAVLEILRQVLREPTLPESEFEVMKNERIAGLEQGRSDPMRQAFNQLQRLLSQYPADDVRYVPTIDEEIERVKDVTSSRSARSTATTSAPSHGELAIVGDFEPSEVLSDPRPDVRGLEEPRALRADRAAVPARPEADQGDRS